MQTCSSGPRGFHMLMLKYLEVFTRWDGEFKWMVLPGSLNTNIFYYFNYLLLILPALESPRSSFLFL